MDDLTIVALLFSIIAIVLWIITFLQSRSTRTGGDTLTSTPETGILSPAQDTSETNMPQIKSNSEERNQDEEFLNDLTKFTQMVRKNLEMINTRIGIKFDIKPLTKRSENKTQQTYVPSMDVSDQDKGKNEYKQQ